MTIITAVDIDDLLARLLEHAAFEGQEVRDLL
jgi:hypothetical protein